MLKNIPSILSPDLLYVMRTMGHGDVLLLADANYPAATGARSLIRLDGVEITAVLDAVLSLFPLDNFVENPVALMKPRPQDPTPEIWSEFKTIIEKHDTEKAFKDFELIERMAFYEYAKNAFAIVQTGTTARYANIAIKKGVI